MKIAARVICYGCVFLLQYHMLAGLNQTCSCSMRSESVINFNQTG